MNVASGRNLGSARSASASSQGGIAVRIYYAGVGEMRRTFGRGLSVGASAGAGARNGRASWRLATS